MHSISSEHLSLERGKEIIDQHEKLTLSKEAVEAIVKCREYLDRKMDDIGRPIYGITTGFGSLYNVTIPKEDLSQLQHNLVMSHACGAGEKVRPEIVKLMLLLKAQSLSYGHSGAQLITVQRLIDMFNEDVLPVVYQQGSLGASGDLAPLAHLSLPLIGLGEVLYKGEVRPAADVWKELGWEPIRLQSKEGLALLNGTQFMSAHLEHPQKHAPQSLGRPDWRHVAGRLRRPHRTIPSPHPPPAPAQRADSHRREIHGHPGRK